MALYQAINGIIQFQLASAYAPGSGVMVVKSGQGAAFGAISPANPVRITLIKQSTYGTGPGEITAIYGVTGRTGDTLTGVSAIEGTTDVAWSVGDYVECRETAGYVNDLEAVLAAKGTVSSVGLTAPVIMNVTGSPVTTTGTLGLSLATQAANTFFSGPPSGGLSTPVFRTIASADFPAGVVPNAALANNNITITPGTGLTGGGTIALGGSATIGIATGTANTLTGFNSGGTFSGVTVGSGLTLSGGTLAAVTGGGGTVTTVSVVTANGLAGTVANASTAPAITLSCPVTGLLKSNGTTIAAAVAGTDYLSSNQTITVSGVVTGSGTTAISTTYPSQAANLFLAGPTTGAATAPTFRAPVAADFPAGVIANAALANSSITVTAGTGLAGGGSVALGGTTTLNMAAGTNNSLAGYNNTGVFSGVTVGSGLSLSAGTLTATSSGGSVTTVSIASANGFAGTVTNPTTTPAITLSTTITGILKGNGTGIFAATAGTDYLNANQTITLSGAVTGSGTTAITATFPNATANTFLAGPTTGAAATPAMRVLVSADFPNGVVTNAALANNSLTVNLGTGLSGGGSVALGGSVAINMTTGAANSLAGYGVGGVFGVVAVGSGLSLSGGTLTATGTGSGSVTNVTVASANGFSGTVANPTTTPAISINGPLTTKGDLFAYSTTNTRLPVGSDGTVVIADSTQATGLRWGTVPNASLANSAVTILAGFGILNAGAVSLGGALSLSTWGQGVINFANHAARNSFVSGHASQLAEGMVVYTANTTGTDGIRGWWTLNPAGTGWLGTDADWTAAGPLQTELGGSVVAARGTLNLIQGANTTITAVDNPSNDRVDVTIASTGTSPLTTKADLYTYSTANARLPVGADFTSLTADSAQATGLSWTGPPTVLMSTVLRTKGNAVLGPGSTTYGTDYTTALQSLINSAASAGQLIIGDGRYSHTGLTFPSNTAIWWLPGCGTILRNGANQQLYRNANPSKGVGGTRGTGVGNDTPGTVGNITDQHIFMKGGIHNCNVTQQTFSGIAAHGTAFWGVSDLWFEDTWFIDGAPWYANCQYFGGRNITCQNNSGPSAGIQLNGPCRRFDFTNVTCINPADDNFAINADDGAGDGVTNYPFGGPITDGVVRGLHMTGGRQGLRFLSASQRIDRIVVEGIRGDTADCWCIVDNFLSGPLAEGCGTWGRGNIGSISISDVSVDISAVQAPSGGETSQADVFIQCGFENISISNWKKESPTAWQPSLYVSCLNENVMSGTLEVDGYRQLVTNASQSGPAFQVGGGLKNLQVRGANIERADGIGPGDSALLECIYVRGDVVPPPGGLARTVLVDNLVARNCNSVVKLTNGSISELLQINGLHLNANGHAAVTIASGCSVRNQDLTRLKSVPISSKKWSGSGTVGFDIDAGGTYTEQANGPLLPNLVAYYRMDETSGTTAADSTGNGATLNAAHAISSTTGPISGHAAIAFDGSQMLTLPLPPTAPAALGPYCSVAGWVKLGATTGNYIVVGKGHGDDAHDRWLTLLWSSVGNFAAANVGGSIGGTPGSITGTNWNHLAVTIDRTYGAAVTTLYVNGASIGTVTWTTPTTAVTLDPTIFGNDNRGTNAVILPAGSAMAGWGIWSAPLSAYQVGLLYNSGSGLNVV